MSKPTQPYPAERFPTDGLFSNATITVGDEDTNVRALTIQLKDGFDQNLKEMTVFDLIVFATTAKAALSTGGSTGVAIGANGLILDTQLAKKVFRCMTDANGLWTGTWTDTGTDTFVLSVVVPRTGKMIDSQQYANAP